jgi:septum formation protein
LSELKNLKINVEDAATGSRSRTHIILASSSPRRLQLLKSIGLIFDVVPSQLEEVIDQDLTPQALVKNLAKQKAEDVFETFAKQHKNILVIGADTMVVLDGKLLGKPADDAEAKLMLTNLSDRTHLVFTGVHIVAKKADSVQCLETVEQTHVTFRKLQEKEIEAYIATREPMDKAGAYALQGIGSALVAGVDGCCTNVIGLPIPKVVSMLRELGVSILGIPACQEDLSK